MNIANIPIESKCRWNSLLHFITDFCNTMAIDVHCSMSTCYSDAVHSLLIAPRKPMSSEHQMIKPQCIYYWATIFVCPTYRWCDIGQFSIYRTNDFSHRFLCDDNLTKIHTNSRLRTIIKAKNWRGLYRSPFHMVRQLSQCLRTWCTVYIFNVPPLILRTDVKIGYKQKMKKEWKKQTTTHIETKTVKQNAQNNYIQRIELTL